MGSRNSGINIPGVILDELKGRDYSNDERFLVKKGKKRAAHQLSRKDRRKLQRAEKKNRGKKEIVVEDVLKSKRKPQVKKPQVHVQRPNNKKNGNGDEKLPFSSDDELSSGDFDEFEEGDLDEEEWQQLKELEEGDSESDSEEESSESSVEEKQSRKNKSVKNTGKEPVGESKSSSEEDVSDAEGIDDDDESFTEEEEELTAEQTMAKLKALKNAKLKKQDNKTNDSTLNNSEEIIDDDVSDDFDGTDESEIDDEDEDEDDELEMTVEETMAKLKALKEQKKSGKVVMNDNDISSGSDQSDNYDGTDESEMDEEFDDEDDESEMTVEETMAKLKALKEQKKSGKVVMNDNDISSGSDQSDNYDGTDESEMDEEFDDEDDESEMTVEETMAKLKALKEQKKSGKVVMNDNDISSGSDQSDNYDGTDESEMDEEFDDEDDESEMTVEETMAKLKALKEQKTNKITNSGESKSLKSVKFDLPDHVSEEERSSSIDDDFSEEESQMTVEETMEALKKAKQDKQKSIKSSDGKKIRNTKGEEEVINFPLTQSERVAIQKDEWDMNYYAKKLGLKGDKRKIRAKDEFDAVGGLLEGLDFFENFDDLSESEEESDLISEDEVEDENSGAESESESDQRDIDKPFSSDDELSSGDFDEFDENDLDEEEWEQLRELEDSDDENDDESDSKSSKKKTKHRENPYVAPSESVSGAYVPPSMRKKLESADSDNATISEIRKKVKSLLNKLSDTNLLVILTSLNELYDAYARQYVTDTIISEILKLISQNNKLLDSFVMNYSAVVYAIWKLRGTEAGASFLQALVEEFLNELKNGTSQIDASSSAALITNKKCSNIISLISYCYNFGLMSSRLIFDIIKKLIANPNEFSTELLLRIVAISGPLIRGDDPSALKEILSELLANMKTVKTSPRLQFLLDVMADLKNNRLKPSILAADHRNIKKIVLNSVRSGGTEEPLQVSLSDIENVDEKGKWWLVGASWKGNMSSAFEEVNTTDNKPSKENVRINDDLLDDIPDWSKIAREQRMNTEVRRAIFISIMSAQDYIEASTKIEKLGLKNKQALEIPKVIIHCLLAEGANNGYNPYYALVASKLYELNSTLTKSFQFVFWDILKKFEDKSNYDSEAEEEETEEEMDEDKSIRKILSQGKFFGSLMAEGILKLDVFKHVPLMGGLTKNGYLFIEVLLFQLLLNIAKKSETKSKNKSGNKEVTYTTSLLNSILINGIKLENKSFILKGLKWFIGKKLKYSDYLAGKRGDKQYIKDCRRIEWAIKNIQELIAAELESTDI
ncbi:Suppressor of glycerol defect protein 1 [Nakaseomyces bracarensis]|uniref:Suppressor of glycerol defect protein 1 n=1 Tax=Nakaseomyces bracarensis TaxID=273131 RepID=A0ABR4NS15_9SACH